MNWLPYLIVSALGGTVGLSEVIATFYQSPREAFRIFWAWILVGLNIITAVGVYVVVNFYAKKVDPLLLAIGVGVGFPTLIRTKFTVAKQFMGSEELSINVGWLYDQFLGWFKSEIDIALVNSRFKILTQFIKKFPDIKKLKEIAHTVLQERSLMSKEEVEKHERYINDIYSSTIIPERAKQIALAKFILNLGGKEYIKNLTKN
jgi:hypothetical protein